MAASIDPLRTVGGNDEGRPSMDVRDQLDYQMLVEQVPGALYRARQGASGEWLYVSPKIEKITGVAAGDFETNPELWFSLIHPDDRDAVLSVEDHVVVTGEPFLAEYRIVRPDGSIVWISDEAMVLMDDAGEPVLQGVMLDITDRKNAELEMESSLSLLQATLEATADGILVVGPSGEVLGFNQRFLQLWHIPDEVARSGDDQALLAYAVDQLADPASFIQRVQELYADPDSESFDVIEFEDGRIYERLSLPRRVSGKSVGRVWSFRDRTEQRAAAKRLRLSESRLRTMLETEPECVKLIDRDGILLEMNPAGLEMIEADSLAAVEGLCIYDLIAEGDREAVIELNRSVFAGETDTLTFDLIGLKGGRRRINTHAVPFRDADGKVIAHLSISRDITEQDRLEEQLRQAQKLEAVGRLAGGVAHDFNNVLTVIGNYANFISEGLPVHDRLREDASEIVRASERAASLVRQLLVFSRKEVVRPRVLDLNEVIVDMDRLLRRTIGEDIEIIVQPMSEPVYVLIDPGQVEQVLLNLGLNARDAMPDGGVLTVTSFCVDLTRSDADLPADADPGSYACLLVGDTGIGMDDEVKAHVFEPFFTTKGLSQGTGLGLASVYGIAKQAGGHVSVESERGRGSTFYFYLPLTTERPADAPKSVRAPGAGAGETILLVEDEEPVRRLVSRILEGAGYNVLALASGLEAVELIRPGAHYDLLLTDVVMPGMSGVELANHLVSRRPTLKVLLMSGYAEEVLFPDQEPSGSRPLLLKPFGKEDLLTKVRELLGTGPKELSS
ncbi:MAG: two-component system, cell cycle sensor histidine kinase and response regulator CckA [Actinomycetota bacterium]|jgi:PAS domain S-box-containing protein|nr:two-component system, cell cycle sensor histidine kinase and response regulator CckA [Actinomycetota bacterium]